MSDESDHLEFDEEIDSRRHDKIIEEVLNLNKIQNVKKPSRTEPTLNISEFNLVKSVTGDQGSVQLNALTKVLKDRKKHKVISKKVKLTDKKSKTLPAPLEKPQADRIRRSINYEKTRLQLDRWEGLVTSNRVASQLVFPLNSTEKLKIIEKKAETYPSTWRVKSELQRELEKIVPTIECPISKDEEEVAPLTQEQLKKQWSEAAKLRAHQSYKEAKARRQNKIKSKKYHRILRKEKIKKTLKGFEELQKTNPEEALKKLEEIEKARAEERFSLRHKGTGQWARNKQIRAKYDKESRQVLSEQLAISRELTQKTEHFGSESEDETTNSEEKLVQDENDDNFWLSNTKPSKEVVDFICEFKKFNEENDKKNVEINHGDNNKNEENTTKTKSRQIITQQLDINPDLIEKRKNMNSDSKGEVHKAGVKCSKGKKKKKHIENVEVEHDENEENTVKTNNSDDSKTTTKTLKKNSKASLVDIKKKLKSVKIKSKSTCQWEVNLLKNGNDVEDMFNKVEEKLEQKLKQKLKKIKKSSNNDKKKKQVNKEKSKTNKIDLSFPSNKKKIIIDEQMNENHKRTDENDIASIDNVQNSDINSLKNVLDSALGAEKVTEVNPENFNCNKATTLSTAAPDILTNGENEESINPTNSFLEIFEDDDIVEEFKKEKDGEIKKDTPANIDLNLPGWGSWGGTDIKPRKRRRRFIIKMPKKMPRRDDNNGSLIINEKAQSKIKPHVVSELPFPFKSVKDYEASLRAPISNTFVPETAFRKLIEPSVITKMGAVIEPITKSILIGEKKI